MQTKIFYIGPLWFKFHWLKNWPKHLFDKGCKSQNVTTFCFCDISVSVHRIIKILLSTLHNYPIICGVDITFLMIRTIEIKILKKQNCASDVFAFTPVTYWLFSHLSYSHLPLTWWVLRGKLQIAVKSIVYLWHPSFKLWTVWLYGFNSQFLSSTRSFYRFREEIIRKHRQTILCISDCYFSHCYARKTLSENSLFGFWFIWPRWLI